jgi:hypothetical protein
MKRPFAPRAVSYGIAIRRYNLTFGVVIIPINDQCFLRFGIVAIWRNV